FKMGKLDGFIDSTGHIILKTLEPIKKNDYVITYSRVSSSENKDNLERQSQRLRDYCAAKGWKIDEEIKEIGSGLNDKRPKLLKILDSGKATTLVVEHKDRLARFGTSYIETACKHFECNLHIINQVETQNEDIIQDFISVITSFCARIYGKRRSKRKSEKLIEELKKS
ncbi:MAG: IS607 family transposase, partial [Nanoarchaeota archaeon]